MNERLATRHVVSLVALAAIVVITLCWWGLALWPLPGTAPHALLRARAICFGTTATGLPDGVGWMTLVGQPLMMTMLLVSITGGETLREGLTGIARSPIGRFGLRFGIVICVTAVLAASWRVADAMGVGDRDAIGRPVIQIAKDYPRLNHPGPALGLVDQHAQVVSLEQFRGHPVIVTFAYAHCETVCPVVVEEAMRARERLTDRQPALVVVTLDPWRDTPARLNAIAAHWNLPSEAHVLSGSVADVEKVLDRWNVGRTRDPRTGEVTHPNLVYIVDAEGRIAYATIGDAGAIEELVGRL